MILSMQFWVCLKFFHKFKTNMNYILMYILIKQVLSKVVKNKNINGPICLFLKGVINA